MTVKTIDQTDCFVSHYERFEKGVGAGGQTRLASVRGAAFSRFRELGFPTPRDEEWRWTNVAPIARTDFLPAPNAEAQVTLDGLETHLFGGCAGRLVFVNGRFAAGLSSVGAAPDGVTLESLASALRADSPVLEPHLARHASFDDQAFTALNTALFEDGAMIHVRKGVACRGPLHVLHVATGGGGTGQPFAYHPRNLVVVDAGAEVVIVETHVGLDDAVYLANPVTEIVAGDGAVVEHTRVVRESNAAYHVSTLQVSQARDSVVRSNTLTLGGLLVRHDINAALRGEGGECHLCGLYLVDGDRLVDNHLVVDHASPHCNSRELFKGILDDRGRGIFSGRIIVREGAQKTDAKQTHMSLLLSDDARVESKPQLEILADDVKCTHGATIGQVDPDAVFYLRSRGLSEDAARGLLVYAFAREGLSEIRVEPLRDQLERRILDRLPDGRALVEDA